MSSTVRSNLTSGESVSTVLTPIPSGRGRRYVQGTASFASPMLHGLSPLVRTPVNTTTTSGNSGLLRGVTINDDEAERRQRRLESHMRTMLSPGCHTPKSTTITADPDRVRTTEAASTALTNAQLAEHYSNCIKLSSENKINARNAFGLHLIDYMLEVLRKRGEMTNFQIAGCTLDASAKIYAGRVDSIYNDAYKMLGGLGRGETQGAGGEGEGSESVAENESENRRRTKKSNVPTSQTTERNPKALDISTFDLEFEVDPLFQKTSAAFDEGGVEGLLLNHLCIRDDSCALMLDAGEVPCSIDTPVHADSIPVKELRGQLDLAQLKRSQICPTFQSFRFTEWSNAQDSNGVWNIDNILSDLNTSESPIAHQYRSQPDADYSMLQCPPVSSNTTTADYDSYDEGNDCGDPHFAGEEELVTQQEAELGFEEVANLGTCGDTQVARVVLPDGAIQGIRGVNDMPGAGVSELCLSEALEPSEYSYFNLAVTSTWAGPNHWKLRPRNNMTQKDDKQSSGKPRKKREAKKPFRIDFNQISDEKQFSKSKAATKLSKSVLEKLSVEQTTLPKDVHTSIDILFKLFHRPQWKVRRQMRAVETLEENPGGVLYDYGNPNDVNYCPVTNENDGDQDSDGVSETLDATGFAAPLGDTFYNQSQSFSSMQGPPSQDQVFQEPLVLAGDNLVAQPRKVHQLQIDYAKSAKRLDVKKLKMKMWQIITENIPDGKGDSPDDKENTVPCENLPHDATSGVTKSFNNGTDFSKLYSTLSSRVSSATAKNLSVPIGFVCLLHLANEKGLKISGVTDFSELHIVT